MIIHYAKKNLSCTKMECEGGLNTKAKDILERLRNYYSDARQWVCFDELRIGTGWKLYGDTTNYEQRIDLWAINCYESKKFEKIAFEIKVSRQDFLHEINYPEKRQHALQLSNRYYFATPKGLVKPEEIPPECGLVEIDNESNNPKWMVEAPYRETEEPTWRFLASLARLGKGEFKIKRLKRDLEYYRREAKDLESTVEHLRERLKRAGLY